jgi:isochorismate synthase EntC
MNYMAVPKANKGALSTLELATSLRTRKGFVWLDSLAAHNHFLNEPGQLGLSLLAAEPYLIIEGESHDWAILEKAIEKRVRKSQLVSTQQGAAIGYFRFDGSFCFGFYEKVYRHYARANHSYWFTPEPIIDVQKQILACAAPICFQSDLTAQEYCQKVLLAQEEIAAGNIYQVCLAHRFTGPFSGDPWPLYLKLRRHNPAPFAAYLNLREETILSTSPECFLKIKGRQISTYPIKGTRPRGANREEDAKNQWELQHSLKEKAELIMITDLERNDLGQICEYGSVTTPRLLELKIYPHLFHLVSKIQGRLRPSISHVEALASCFPGGSISGAPKKSALRVITELEPVPRGLFTGAIGYFGFDGRSQFSIAIRTLVVHENIAQFHVGSGITSDSIAHQEWEETLHKAAGIIGAV